MSSDQIHIRGLHVVAPHGVYQEERDEGRAFTVDLDAFISVREAGRNDALQQTVDYRDLSSAILRVLGGPSRSLIEALAEEICEEALRTVDVIDGVRVTVWKRAKGVPGDPERVGVTIERHRREGARKGRDSCEAGPGVE